MNLSGTPGVRTTITDLSVIVANSLKGIICVQGPTKRGEEGKEVLITSWTEFRREFGSLTDEDKFPLYCKHALDNGAKLRVTRAHHYTDIDDLSTVDGTKATGTKDVISVAETLATTTYTVTLAGGDGDTVTLRVDEGSGPVIIATTTKVTGDTVDTLASKLVINCLTTTGTHGYTAAVGGSTDEIDVTAPVGSGIGANSYTPDVIVTGTLTATAGTFTGGVDQVIASSVTIDAKGVGAGYDDTQIVITASSSNESDKIDIEVILPDSDISFVVSNVVNNPNTTQLADINAKLQGVEITNVTTEIAPGTVILTGGDQVLASIIVTDYTGSATAKNGWHSFDEVVDSMRIMNFNKADADADIGLVAYVVARKDMRAVTRTPLGLTAPGIDDYRNGEGVYSHTAIDSLYADLWYTDVEITDPSDVDIKNLKISAIGHYAGARARTDNLGEWFAASGSQNGRITGVNKVGINFISPGNKGQYDSLYEQGVNAIVNHPQFGIASWGNRSLLKNKTKLTSKQNIADLVVFISRTIKAIAEEFTFIPNDFTMFNQLYRTVLPFIKNTLVDGRAIQGDTSIKKGEGIWWHWMGDQFAKTPNDLTFNTPEDIDAGKYKVRFAFKPIAANEYIVIDIAPADSATILDVQVLTNL